jgi:hypothetical protein
VQPLCRLPLISKYTSTALLRWYTKARPNSCSFRGCQAVQAVSLQILLSKDVYRQYGLGVLRPSTRHHNDVVTYHFSCRPCAAHSTAPANCPAPMIGYGTLLLMCRIDARSALMYPVLVHEMRCGDPDTSYDYYTRYPIEFLWRPRGGICDWQVSPHQHPIQDTINALKYII